VYVALLRYASVIMYAYEMGFLCLCMYVCSPKVYDATLFKIIYPTQSEHIQCWHTSIGSGSSGGGSIKRFIVIFY